MMGFEKRERAVQGQLIGLGGKLRAGKDAVADYLEANKNFVKLGMSDALDEALLLINPWVRVDYDFTPVEPWKRGLRRGRYHKGEFIRYQDLHAAVGYVEAKTHADVREYLQKLGTEVGREMIDPNVWVKIVEAKIKNLWAEGKSVVITAVRFPNEVEMIDRLGGETVWVNRPDEARGVSEGINTAHASENSVSQDDFGLTIENTGTLEDLYDWTDAILDGLKREPATDGPVSTHQGYWKSRTVDMPDHEVVNGRPMQVVRDAGNHYGETWPTYDH